VQHTLALSGLRDSGADQEGTGNTAAHLRNEVEDTANNADLARNHKREGDSRVEMSTGDGGRAVCQNDDGVTESSTHDKQTRRSEGVIELTTGKHGADTDHQEKHGGDELHEHRAPERARCELLTSSLI